LTKSRAIDLKTLLLPRGWFVAAVLLWWALRGVGLYMMRAFGELPFEAFDFANALLFDGLMMWGIFLRARAFRLLSCSPESTLRSVLRPLLAVEVPVLIFLMTLLRVVDVVSCYFSLSHADETLWHHVAPGSLGYATDPRVVLALVGIAAVAGAVAALAARDARGVLRVLDGTDRTAKRAVLLTLGFVAVAWSGPIAAPMLQTQHPHHWAIVPEVNAAYTLLRSKMAKPPANPKTVRLPKIAPETVKKWRKAGLIAADQDPNGAWPMLRRGIGEIDTLPLQATPTGAGSTGAARVVPLARVTEDGGTRPPNVLIVLVESLNTAFTGFDPRSRHQKLMPRLREWSHEMTLVSGFHNVASPTANGLVASFCSTLPAAAVQEIEVGGSVDKGAAYRCISDVLREHGYRSHFARGASKVYMACEASLRSHGFDEVYGREDLSELYPNRPVNSWGYYDATLVDFLLSEMDRLKASAQPWLYTTLTVNSHLPGFAETDCKPPPEIAANQILTGYWCTDRALDKLFKGLKKKGLWDNTIVMVTGDHAQLPTRKVQKLIDDPDLFGAFAPMPLLIHDPVHRLPPRITRLSSQLDLAPTLMHLIGLDVAKLEHSFMGWSIFGERRAHPFIVGRTGARSAYLQTATARASVAMGTLAGLCSREVPLLPDGSSPLSACELDTYYKWLDAVWAGHRLYPADRYNGGIGTDAELLRLKWLRYDRKEERVRQQNGVRERVEPSNVGRKKH
jgi:hypothetical protein